MRTWLAVALVCAAAVALRLAVMWALDLRDLPGAASGTLLLTLGRTAAGAERPPALVDLNLAWWAQVSGLDLLAATRVGLIAAAVASVIGAALGGWALADRRGAVLAAALAALWGPAVLTGVLVSYDGLAHGAAWLGAGLVLAGARVHGWGVVPVLAGLAVVAWGVLAKELAHPSLAWLLAAPFVPRRGHVALRRHLVWVLLLAVLSAVGVAAVQGLVEALRDAGTGRVTQVGLPSLLTAADGLRACWRLLAPAPWVFNLGLALAVVAGVGTLLPGPGWPGRLVLGALGFASLGLAAHVMGSYDLRPRYLLVPSWPLVALAGVALARLHQRLGRLGPFVSAAALGLVLHDTLDLAASFDAQRQAILTLEPSRLPAMPHWRWNVNDRRVGFSQGDLTLPGTETLPALLAQLPPGDVAAPTFLDNRHRQVLAHAVVQGRRAHELEQRRCCGDRSPAACAAEVAHALDQGRAIVILPGGRDAQGRTGGQNLTWARALEGALVARGRPFETTSTGRWRTWSGTGAGGVQELCGVRWP